MAAHRHRRAKPTASSRLLPNGRNRYGGHHARLYDWELQCAAYRSLGCQARCLLTELKALFNGRNNGQIAMSVREAMRRLGTGRKLAEKALAELQDRGFIKATVKGSFHCKARHATLWRLAEFDCDGQPASKEFMRWSPPAEKHGAPREHRRCS